MPVMNFDLEDGKPPVSFNINTEGAERFMAFMAECQAARDTALSASAPVVAMTDDEIYNFWLYRDCMPSIQAGDMRGQFISAARALLASAGVEVKP